ncbi:MAG: hypothetical protein OSJ23_10110 [Mucispirillum schaedleri]|nr:hypothetical protein [Mucispirillum schaedleri]
MNELQKQKAIEAIERKKAKERKQWLAMMYHLAAYTKIHFMGVMLPYRVLLDLEKAEHEKTFTEVPPNPYYPNPALTLKTKYSQPTYSGELEKVRTANGEPDFFLDEEYRQKWEEYEKRVDAEKMSVDDWGYYYGRFLLPYDLESFSDFDFWGKVPEGAKEKQVVDGMRMACLEVWNNCKEHPENYNFEPIPRLEEHKTIYDVGYGYI